MEIKAGVSEYAYLDVYLDTGFLYYAYRYTCFCLSSFQGRYHTFQDPLSIPSSKAQPLSIIIVLVPPKATTIYQKKIPNLNPPHIINHIHHIYPQGYHSLLYCSLPFHPPRSQGYYPFTTYVHRRVPLQFTRPTRPHPSKKPHLPGCHGKGVSATSLARKLLYPRAVPAIPIPQGTQFRRTRTSKKEIDRDRRIQRLREGYIHVY